MTRSWSDVRQEAVDAGQIDNRQVEGIREGLQAAERAYRLAEIRKAQSATQKEIAALMNVSQARVSNIERGQLSRTELGTLEAYVEALGGRLRIVADFGNDSITVG